MRGCEPCKFSAIQCDPATGESYMNARACGLALLIPGLVWSANVFTGARDPRVGYWIEEKVSSSYPQAQGLQISFEDLGGGVFRYKLGANHDAENMLVVEARCDGKEYPLVDGNGKANGRTYSCRVTGPRSVESTTGHDPASPGISSTVVETVSEDGKTLTGTGTYRDASGKVLKEVRRHFTRRSP
jgi:hypothetical protein